MLSLNHVDFRMRDEMEILKQQIMGKGDKDADDETLSRIISLCNTGPMESPISLVSPKEKLRQDAGKKELED
jgi:hypothetical protein